MIFFFVITLITYIKYLKASISDPGYVNSVMFSKVCQQVNDTDISQNYQVPPIIIPDHNIHNDNCVENYISVESALDIA